MLSKQLQKSNKTWARNSKKPDVNNIGKTKQLAHKKKSVAITEVHKL